MKAYVTSIGEPTTELCGWSLSRNGFEVHLLDAPNISLAEKLKWIYEDRPDEDFVRVDADVIVNRHLTPDAITQISMKYPLYVVWVQLMSFGWFRQEAVHGGIQFIKKAALPTLRDNIDKFMTAERPESQMFRLDDFEDPRKCVSYEGQLFGIHGYAQNDIDRVKETKLRRGQYDNYDWELVERLNAL